MARLANGNVMKEGRRNVVGVHQVAPRVGIGPGLVHVPLRAPLVATQLTPAALAIGPLEPEHPRDHRVLPAPRPWGMASPPALLADLNHMQHHRRVGHHHVGDGVPRVALADQCVVVPEVAGSPAMERAGFVGPRKGKV